MGRLEQVITTMVEIFTEYADDQGRKRKLCKEELQAMLQKEIESSEFKINPEDIVEAMKTVDKNKDEELNFREFSRCVANVATSYYRKKKAPITARLEQVITTMVEIFTEYADDQGPKRKLCKEELQAMLQKEIESPEFKTKINPEDIVEAMKTVDKNKDEELNFREFSRCVANVATSYYRKKNGKEGGGQMQK